MSERKPVTDERCRICQRGYSLVWQSPNELWRQISGWDDGSGLLCPSCFNSTARTLGISLYWSCQADIFPSATIAEQKEKIERLKLWQKTTREVLDRMTRGEQVQRRIDREYVEASVKDEP